MYGNPFQSTTSERQTVLLTRVGCTIVGRQLLKRAFVSHVCLSQFELPFRNHLLFCARTSPNLSRPAIRRSRPSGRQATDDASQTELVSDYFRIRNSNLERLAITMIGRFCSANRQIGESER